MATLSLSSHQTTFMQTILYLTDLYYEAKGRKYYEEDLYITSRLKEHFHVLIGNPRQAISFLDVADFIVFRNTGPVIYYQDYFRDFLSAVREKEIVTFNSFDGKADTRGKQYLVDLSKLGFPVIPTVDSFSEIDQLGMPEKYITKIKDGADSIGMEVLSREELLSTQPTGKLIQTWVNFEYEVSFYYINDTFQYALYAPDKQKRWELVEYIPTPADLQFADQFVAWNAMACGISRVDACRLRDGGLWLVELEDLNPFLSIDLLSSDKRELFITNLIEAFMNLKQTP